MKQNAVQLKELLNANTDLTALKQKLTCPYAESGGDEIVLIEGIQTEANLERTDETNGVNSSDANGQQQQSGIDKPTGLGSFTTAKIETVKENLKAQSLTVQQINDYCKPLFIFKNIRVMRFKWVSTKYNFLTPFISNF